MLRALNAGAINVSIKNLTEGIEGCRVGGFDCLALSPGLIADQSAEEITEELFEKLDEKTILNIHDQNGGNAGQFVSANDMDEIIKVVNEVASPYKELIEQCKSQIRYLEEENRFLKALLAEKSK